MPENKIASYVQDTPFTSANAGTAEWCFGRKDGREFFIKRFLSPTYPSGDLGLDPDMTQAMAGVFHRFVSAKTQLYNRLRAVRNHRFLVVPEEVFTYQFHLVAVSEKVSGDIKADAVCRLHPWHRLSLMGSLNAALAAVHEAGVVHSDLKPENLMISKGADGRYSLRLIDFDGSFPEDEPPTDAEEITGDMVYFAPETIVASLGRDVTLNRSIDLFALGIILHEFWTGARPAFSLGHSTAECLLRKGEVTLNPHLPPPLQDLIRKLLSLNPADRPDCGQVDRVLREMISHLKEPKPERPSTAAVGGSVSGTSAPPPPPNMVKVIVECRDVTGYHLKRQEFTIPRGTSKQFFAPGIEGRQVVGRTAKIVEAVADCPSSVLVTFVYRKKRNVGAIVAWVVGGIATLMTIGLLIGNLSS